MSRNNYADLESVLSIGANTVSGVNIIFSLINNVITLCRTYSAWNDPADAHNRQQLQMNRQSATVSFERALSTAAKGSYRAALNYIRNAKEEWKDSNKAETRLLHSNQYRLAQMHHFHALMLVVNSDNLEKDKELCLKLFQSSLDLNGNEVQVYNDFGIVLSEVYRDYSSAEVLFLKSIRLNGNQPLISAIRALYDEEVVVNLDIIRDFFDKETRYNALLFPWLAIKVITKYLSKVDVDREKLEAVTLFLSELINSVSRQNNLYANDILVKLKAIRALLFFNLKEIASRSHRFMGTRLENLLLSKFYKMANSNAFFTIDRVSDEAEFIFGCKSADNLVSLLREKLANDQVRLVLSNVIVDYIINNSFFRTQEFYSAEIDSLVVQFNNLKTHNPVSMEAEDARLIHQENRDANTIINSIREYAQGDEVLNYFIDQHLQDKGWQPWIRKFSSTTAESALLTVVAILKNYGRLKVYQVNQGSKILIVTDQFTVNPIFRGFPMNVLSDPVADHFTLLSPISNPGTLYSYCFNKEVGQCRKEYEQIKGLSLNELYVFLFLRSEGNVSGAYTLDPDKTLEALYRMNRKIEYQERKVNEAERVIKNLERNLRTQNNLDH